MNNLGKKVKIVWNDTKVFSPKNLDVSISKMETTGIVENENENQIIIKDPITINLKTGRNHPEQKPTFYLIPKGMIETIELVDK